MKKLIAFLAMIVSAAALAPLAEAGHPQRRVAGDPGSASATPTQRPAHKGGLRVVCGSTASWKCRFECCSFVDSPPGPCATGLVKAWDGTVVERLHAHPTGHRGDAGSEA